MAAHTHSPLETISVVAHRVACDGAKGALGHPRIWLQIPEATGRIDCPYCGKRFIYSSPHANAAANEKPLSKE